MDLSKELLTPLIDALAFLGQAASETNHFRRDIIRSRLPGRVRQLAKNVPNGLELLFGLDHNKRITQINKTNNALPTKPSNTVSYKPATNQMGRYSNGKNTTYQHHHQNSSQYPKKLTLWKDQTLHVPQKIPHNEHEKCIINAEIEKLLQKGVIIKCEKEDNDFVSTVFTQEKKDGSFRTMLNLKCLNKFVKGTSTDI